MTHQDWKNALKTRFKKESLEAWLLGLLCSESGCTVSARLYDIVHFGCVSGCLSELIYTHDCLRFYTQFETKIWEAVDEWRENTGQTLGQFLDSFSVKIENQITLRVYLTWFAVEQAAQRIWEKGGCA